MKKLLALVLALSLICLAGCAPSENADPAETQPASSDTDPGASATEPGKQAVGGKILFMSNMNAGPQYEAYMAYLKMACDNLGYSYEVFFGDESNDPAGNLQATQNVMTNDVVGLITTQDGGLAEIMAEYPDLYVAGFMSDMAGVFGEDGAAAACKESDHFLGTVADQCVNGSDLGKVYFDLVVEKGYKKVATIAFPPFAYPQLMVADATFRGLVEEYNATAAEPIEIVGEVEVLMFQPLSDAYFMDASHQDLDAIIAPLAGCTFVYPALKAAIDSGVISGDTKLITSGFETDPNLIADFGDDGVISAIVLGGVESMVWPVVMLDNAIQGAQFSDFSAPEALDSALFVIDSKEDMDKVLSSSLLGTGDIANAAASWDVISNLLVRNNPDATYAGLKDFLSSDTLTVDGLK